MSYACIFPGQGSQSVGMLQELAEQYPEVRETFEQAGAAIDQDLWKLVCEGPAEALNQTTHTQPVLLAAGMAVWRLWQARASMSPDFLAGHSLGEYTAWVAAQSLSMDAAVPLVRQRGELMQQAVAPGEGAMAAVLGLEGAVVRDLCKQQSTPQAVVDAANFNAPGQVVLSGHKEAVAQAIEACKAVGARRALVLPVSVPSHSTLMQSTAEVFAALLTDVEFSEPAIRVVDNVAVATPTTSKQIRDTLARQLYSPVRWAESVSWIIDQGVDTLIELGPGRVLTGLNRRIDRSVRAICVDTPESLEQALELIST